MKFRTFETGGQEAVIVRVRERFAAELARRKIRLPITASVDDLEEVKCLFKTYLKTLKWMNSF